MAIGHATQFSYKLHEHYHALLYSAQVSVVKMYISKYTVKNYYTYPPPFIEDTLEHCNYEVYVITGSLENMYRYQYSRDYYGSVLHPFKVVML